MKAFVINLDRDRTRWQSTSRLLQGLGLDVERVTAVDGQEEGGRDTHFLSAGEQGCFQSHLKALERFLESGLPIALIFEDDIGTTLDANSLAHKVQTALPLLDTYDLIYLGKCFCECGTLTEVAPGLYSTWGALCLHAYMVSRRGALSLLKVARDPHHYLRDPIDLVYYRQTLLGRLQAATFHPSLFYQDPEHHPSRLRNKRDARLNVEHECARWHHLVFLRSLGRRLWRWLVTWGWVLLLLLLVLGALALKGTGTW